MTVNIAVSFDAQSDKVFNHQTIRARELTDIIARL